MAKKRKRKESTDKKSNKQSSKNCNSKQNSNSKQNNNDNIKFSDFSYAELIVLAATLSYSLSEELDEDDLAILLVFLGLLAANVQTLVAQKIIKDKKQGSVTEGLDLELETDI